MRAAKAGRIVGWLLILFIAGLSVPGCDQIDGGRAEKAEIIRIGSKNFTEQIILGEMLAQLIEYGTSLQVERMLNLGGTVICHSALVNGEIDLYPEYTGTALTAILKEPVPEDRDTVFSLVRSAYREKFGATWLDPFGFNNTYAITVRREDAAAYGWRTIDDLAEESHALRAGFTAEFVERPDGYPGLAGRYGFSFGEVKEMDPGLMYSAVNEKAVDVISGFATDGRIPAYDLQVLEDDRQFFPPYRAAAVVRSEVLALHPVLKDVLNALSGAITDPEMQHLNFLVDEEKRDPKDVVREFLLQKGLIREEQT